MSEARLGRDSESHRGSSNEGDSVGMKVNPTRQVGPRNPVQPLEQVEPPWATPNIPNAQNPQVESTPSRAPIDQLSQHRAYTFAGTIEEKPEEAEYWIERTTQILTKKLQCSDEHKLECAIALLADEALSWWETTTLTAPAEKVTWSFFVEEFKKKYISDHYLADLRKYFLHLEQGNKPVEQYVAELCKYCKYGAEYIKTEKYKCRRFTNGLNGDLSPMFTTLEIEDFQILVNRVIAAEAKMKVVEKDNEENKSSKKQKRNENPQGKSKKGNSSRKLERILPCEFCQKRHRGQCQIQSNLCYACGGDDHFFRDCPQNTQKAPA
ncbi:hypothetical protein V6N13_100561 [Hibiscus sabdariffa]